MLLVDRYVAFLVLVLKLGGTKVIVQAEKEERDATEAARKEEIDAKEAKLRAAAMGTPKKGKKGKK